MKQTSKRGKKYIGQFTEHKKIMGQAEQGEMNNKVH